MSDIHITDIEQAINWWRNRVPSDTLRPCPQVCALAEVYGLMVYDKKQEVGAGSITADALDAWMDWYHSTPDAPCIAICSTSQGDELCKGCGRTFEEVQHWPVMTPTEKRVTWRRITLEATAWRFNRYSERCRETKHE